jgi:hypothetical protein
MKALAPLLLASVLATGCFKPSSTPGVVHTGGDNPLVSIGAGEIELGGVNALMAWYVIDRAAQSCWFFVHSSAAPMDCCQVRRLEAGRPHITWENDVTCAPMAEPAGSLAPAAAPPTPPAPAP